MTPRVDVLGGSSVRHSAWLPALLHSVLGPMTKTATETPLGAVLRMDIGEGGDFPNLAMTCHDQLRCRFRRFWPNPSPRLKRGARSAAAVQRLTPPKCFRR